MKIKNENYNKIPESTTELSEKELRNEEVILEILENHDINGIEKIRNLFNLSKGQIELASQYAGLRKSTISEMEKELENRKKENPDKTAEEEKLGVFIEKLEPQVKNTILRLQTKGYKTYESGFKLFGDQMIGFRENYFQNPKIFKDLQDKLKTQDINLEIKPDHLILGFKKFYSINEMKEIWDKIADELPELEK